MNILTPYSKRLAGFSLVEMAIVILIAGIMMGAGLSLLAVKQAAAQADVTRKNQEIIKQALINYLGKNKRLPCPADTTGTELRPVTSPLPSLPPCLNYSGVVPYATLGLERSVALDGWENFIDYVITPPATPAPATPPYNAWLYTYSATPSTLPCDTSICSGTNLSFWPSNTAGSIIVTGSLSSMVAALISHGKNGYGAVNIKGVKNVFLGAGTDEIKNISITLPITIVKRDTSDTPTGNAFDDVVMVLSANDLISPLVTNGTFQSPQSALAQANNIVLGNIVAVQNLCPDANSCPTTEHYFTIPSTPSGVSDLGVMYTRYSSTISTKTLSGNAYKLDVGDGSPKSVSIDELRGILARNFPN